MSDEALRRRARDARERAARNKETFDATAFAPYGLDTRWSGLRWFGGHGTSNGRVQHLELAHGDDLGDATSMQVRIETHFREAAAGRDSEWSVAQSLVQHFWQETGVLPDDVRRAMFPIEAGEIDPFGPWDTFVLEIDDVTVPFRVLAHGGYWVAIGTRVGAVVAIRSRGWPLDRTGIVTIDDLDPYLEGSVEVVMRWRP